MQTDTYGHSIQYDEGLRKYMLGVYNLMFSGLLLSGVVAWAIGNVPGLTNLFYAASGGYTGLMWIAIFAPLAIIIGLSWKGAGLSHGAMRFWYWAFVALEGVGLSHIGFHYAGTDILAALFSAAALFGGMSLYGYTTKKDMTGMGAYLFAGLVALIVVMVINIFLASTMMQWIICIAGVGLFMALTAWDTQMIKSNYSEAASEGDVSKMTTWSAIALYLDFLNMFLFILQMFGLWSKD